MLKHTFIHVPGVGAKREHALWRRGYTDWERFAARHPAGSWKSYVEAHLNEEAVVRNVPSPEAWRLLTAFPGRTAYLDIETTGLSVRGREDITCIGLSDGVSVQAFVQGDSLDAFPDALSRHRLVVTFNGAAFDLPILRRAFPEMDWSRLAHVDLRYPLRRLGLRGGLKKIERRLGLARSDSVEGVDGWMAVRLWRAHVHGHPTALETLVRYCLEDVAQLKPLAAYCFNRLVAGVPLEVGTIRDVAPPGIPFEADPDLVQQLLRDAAPG